MKKEDLLKIFGTEYPSIEEYLNWITENNPKTLQPWNPPLNFQEKAILSDDELIEESRGSNYPHLPIEGAAFIINSIRETREESISLENFLLCINELEKLFDSWSYNYPWHRRVRQVLEKHEISVNETAKNLKKKIWERKNELFSYLSKRIIAEGSTESLDSPVRIGRCLVASIASREEYNSLENTIIRGYIEDMKKNPRNWKIFKASGVALPWTGSSGGVSYVERRDGKIKIYETELNQQQWKEIEKALGRNFFLAILQSS